MQSRFAGSGMPPLLAVVVEVEKELWLAGLPVVRIMSVDPGVITGVSVFWIHAETGEILAWAETLITHDEVKQVLSLMSLLRALADCGRVWVVIENFTVQQLNMSEEFLSPCRIGRQFAFGAELMSRSMLADGPVFGSIEDIAWQGNGRLADYRDDRLKKLGFYTPGPDHRRDATRHALVRWKRLKLQLETNKNVRTVAAYWEPELAKVPDLGTVKDFGRTFNGTPTGSHGQPAPKRVTKEDMQRIAVASGRRSGKETVMAKQRDEIVDGTDLKWVPLASGKGFVLEHDPKTQSGIAPRRGTNGPKTTPSEPVPSEPGAVQKTRKRTVKKLV